MLRPTLTLASLLLQMAIVAQHSVVLKITALPEYHPTGADIYAAGSFNGWNPQDPNFRFQKDTAGNYFLPMRLDSGRYEYKLTRGAWDKAECKKAGAGMENRRLQVSENAVVDLNIIEWSDRFPSTPAKSTASARVQVLDTAFFIPQLKRTRRVWIYLPADYQVGKKKYPVLYMHDGQNLFDDATSYSGEWGIDEFLDTTKLPASIIVGIDNGGVKRMNEYNPYDNERFGKGEGSAYVDFLVKTLKPYIDKRFRTEKDRAHTYIAGSSMGGLISLYAALRYPAVFGGVGVFSPAFWISGSGIYDDIRRMGKKTKAKIYFYGGGMEGETMVPDMLKAYEGMAEVSGSRLFKRVEQEAGHNEGAWRKEFPAFYRWLSE